VGGASMMGLPVEGEADRSSVRRTAVRWGQAALLGVFMVRSLGCGLDTDADHDGFYGAPELDGNYLYDCDDTNKEITHGETFYRDSDGDGLGDLTRPCFICLSPTEPTPASSVTATSDQSAVCGEAADAGVAYVHNSLDCDDTDKKLGYGVWYYRDSDDDGLGDPSVDLALYSCPAGPTDQPPTGYSTNDLDCNDDDDPYQEGSVKGIAKIYYLDSDFDGYGGPIPFQTCGDPPETGYVLIDETTPADCDDSDKLVHPFAKFDCDDGFNKDNDCDGVLDEDEGKSWYPDNDKDGFGDATSPPVVYCPPPENYVSNNADCNDADKAVYPGASGGGGCEPPEGPP
jgi:hypothetical protein